MKTKALLKQLFKNTDDLEQNNVNMHNLSTSLKILQENIDIIKALKAPPMDPENLKIPVFGTTKQLVLNIPKLHEAVNFEDIPTEDEKEEQTESKPKPKLDIYIPPEDHKYLYQVLKGFKKDESSDNLLERSTMVQLLKFIGDFAKTKNEEISKQAQQSRLEFYGKDDQMYINTIKQTLITEEQNYNYCTKAILFRAKISEDTFVKSEHKLLSDPMAQLELMKNSIDTSCYEIELPEALDKSITTEIIKKANEMAFFKYKQLHDQVIKTDPNLTPVLITCLSHDYILDVYGYNEEVFKAAIQRYKVFDDPELSMYIQNKQMELMSL